MSPPPKLKKVLRFFDIYALALGSTMAGGFFVLPGLAHAIAGPTMVAAYFLAVLPLVPGIFAQTELATAMPRAGGLYYFLDRSLGPLFGTIGGLGVWLVLVLKTVFALIGLAAYVELVWPNISGTGVACGVTLFFGLLNLFGTKKTGLFQIVLVVGVLGVLGWFTGTGLTQLDKRNFEGFFDRDVGSLVAAAGFICVSYVGFVKVAALAEEVEDPERNLPLGLFVALGSALLIYAVGTTVMVGVVPPDELRGSLVPVARTAELLGGRTGLLVVTGAAVFAFSSVANAGIMSASRYPMAMARDRLLPEWFGRISTRGIPTNGIAVTVALIVASLLVLDALRTAKLAGAFQLLMFAFVCVAVIVMRESQIESYDPGYRSPGYPWLHLIGFCAPIAVILMMGPFPLLFAGGLVLLGIVWHRIYGHKRVERSGAIFHVFARWGEQRYAHLDRELRGILKEKGLRAGDPFDEMIARADVVDLAEDMPFDGVVRAAAECLSKRIGLDSRQIAELFQQGTQRGATPVSRGSALPHIRVSHIAEPFMVLVRSRPGVRIDMLQEFWGEHAPEEKVHALFFMAGPDNEPKRHLRILAQLAEISDVEGFIESWLAAESESELKETLLREERFLTLRVQNVPAHEPLLGRELREIRWPEGALVALINRGGRVIIPRGSTAIHPGDRLTILGEPEALRRLHRLYQAAKPEP